MALSAADYDERGTELCERALVTVVGDAGFWGRSLYLVGGLVPRYLVGAVVPPTPVHVGSRDVDLAVAFAVDGFDATGYETLERNLRDGGFKQAPNEDDPEFRWRRTVDGRDLVLEFLCDTDEVPRGPELPAEVRGRLALPGVQRRRRPPAARGPPARRDRGGAAGRGRAVAGPGPGRRAGARSSRSRSAPSRPPPRQGRVRPRLHPPQLRRWTGRRRHRDRRRAP